MGQELKKIEDAIEKVQVEKSAIESELAQQETYSTPDKLAKVQLEFERVSKQLEDANIKWEALAVELESLE